MFYLKWENGSRYLYPFRFSLHISKPPCCALSVSDMKRHSLHTQEDFPKEKDAHFYERPNTLICSKYTIKTAFSHITSLLGNAEMFYPVFCFILL